MKRGGKSDQNEEGGVGKRKLVELPRREPGVGVS